MVTITIMEGLDAVVLFFLWADPRLLTRNLEDIRLVWIAIVSPLGSRRRSVACSVACSQCIVAPGGLWQYYAMHQYSVVRRVWGRGGVAIFLIFGASTPPRILMGVFYQRLFTVRRARSLGQALGMENA